MSSKEETTLTQRDIELLSKGLTCVKSELAIDYEQLREKCGLKNADSAKAGWNRLVRKVKKLGENTAATATEAAEEAANGTAAPAKKRKAAKGSEETEAAPAPKNAKGAKGGRKPKGKAGKEASPAAGSDDEAKVKNEDAEDE